MSLNLLPFRCPPAQPFGRHDGRQASLSAAASRPLICLGVRYSAELSRIRPVTEDRINSLSLSRRLQKMSPMRLLHLVLWVLISSVTCRGADPALIDRLCASTVRIVTYDEYLVKNAVGSGVIVAPTFPITQFPTLPGRTPWEIFTGSLIVTNAHVIAGASRIEIQTRAGKRSKAGIRWRSVDWDLAVLQATDTLGDGLAVQPSTPAQGANVYVVGMPEDLPWSVSTGIIAALRDEQIGPGVMVFGKSSGFNFVTFEQLGLSLEPIPRRLLQITAAISPGNSGGPICDENGKWIGITCSSLDRGQNLNFGIAIDTNVARIITLSGQVPAYHPAESSYGIGVSNTPVSELNNLGFSGDRERLNAFLDPDLLYSELQGTASPARYTTEALSTATQPLAALLAPLREDLIPDSISPLVTELTLSRDPALVVRAQKRVLDEFPRELVTLSVLLQRAKAGGRSMAELSAIYREFLLQCAPAIPESDLDPIEAQARKAALWGLSAEAAEFGVQ